jgi:hypothetical protein
MYELRQHVEKFNTECHTVQTNQQKITKHVPAFSHQKDTGG